jgi:hypothetical protein
VFKLGFRLIHPSFFRANDKFHSQRETLAFLYSVPCALLTLSLPFGPELDSIRTGRFLSGPNVPSSGMPSLTQFLVVECVLALLFAVAFYGFGMAWLLDEVDNVASSTPDTVIVGGLQGALILSVAIFMHRLASFNHTPHFITTEEWAECFFFNALLAGTIFNSYRLRRAYGIDKTQVD